MNTNLQSVQCIYPALRYDDAKGAISWLTSVLGFEEQVVYPGDGESIAHAQLIFRGNVIMLGSVDENANPYTKSPKTLGGVATTIYIALESAHEVDAQYARAKGAGAQISREICDTDYGSHEFSVSDPEGHGWTFGTYRPGAE